MTSDAYPHTPVGKGEWVVHEQNQTTAHDNTGICLFVGGAGGTLDDLVPCTAAAITDPVLLPMPSRSVSVPAVTRVSSSPSGSSSTTSIARRNARTFWEGASSRSR